MEFAMTKNEGILVGIAAAAYAAFVFARTRGIFGTSGIGAAKRPVRRIWSEVQQAQSHGIDLSDPDGWKRNADILRTMSRGKLTTNTSGKPDEQRYFNQLRRAYKSIAGTGLPYDESVVRNEYGDTILVYRDYHLDELPKKAAEWIESTFIRNGGDDTYGAYWKTIADIATGRVKFVWASDGVHRGAQQLIFGQSVPAERKMRISYLASPAKGGQYPEAYAHYLWESVFGTEYTTDQDILNGVLDAIRDCTSVGQAQQMVVDEYLKAHQPTEQPLWSDVPF